MAQYLNISKNEAPADYTKGCTNLRCYGRFYLANYRSEALKVNYTPTCDFKG